MSGSTIYNHRSLQLTAPAHGHSHVANTLDAMKQEYNLVTNKLDQARTLGDEYQSKVDTPINELNIIRQTVEELEAQHGKVRQRHEHLRERERLGERSGERDQEREQRDRERDPKRLKINVPGRLRKLWLKIRGPYHFGALLPPRAGLYCDGWRVYYRSDFGIARVIRAMSDVFSGEADGKKLILKRVPDIHAALEKYKGNWPEQNLAFALGYVEGENFIVLHAGSNRFANVGGGMPAVMLIIQLMQMKVSRTFDPIV
ncbi:hypothetical protein B0H14DRAFT_3600177 [Mycena olivaceomarginata]|nr:hypothetical protein B0H14DRAFT_3600177 [Mycena olivaceomarginata]